MVPNGQESRGSVMMIRMSVYQAKILLDLLKNTTTRDSDEADLVRILLRKLEGAVGEPVQD
jgi:hypothetical protein